MIKGFSVWDRVERKDECLKEIKRQKRDSSSFSWHLISIFNPFLISFVDNISRANNKPSEKAKNLITQNTQGLTRGMKNGRCKIQSFLSH